MATTTPHGLIRPLRRDGRGDFSHGDGEARARALIGQAIGTRAFSHRFRGELPWRPDAGSKVYLLRHGKTDLIARELGLVYVADAVRKYVPAVKLQEIGVDAADETMSIRVRWALAAKPTNDDTIEV